MSQEEFADFVRARPDLCRRDRAGLAQRGVGQHREDRQRVENHIVGMSRNRRVGDCLQIMVKRQRKAVGSDLEF